MVSGLVAIQHGQAGEPPPEQSPFEAALWVAGGLVAFVYALVLCGSCFRKKSAGHSRDDVDAPQPVVDDMSNTENGTTKAQLPELVSSQIKKIDQQAPAIEADWRHVEQHGSLPAEAEAVMVEQSLDAIASQRAMIRKAEAQLESRRAANRLYSKVQCKVPVDRECDGLIVLVAEAKQVFAASIADFATKGYGDLPAGIDGLTTQDLEDMPLASTDTTCDSYTPSAAAASAVRGINLQRVIGHYCVLEARSAAGGNTAAATAAGANLNEPLAVYARRVVQVTPALAGQIITDVSSYEQVMAARKQIAAEVEGLVRMAAAGEKHPQTAPGTDERIAMESAEALVSASEPDAPPAGNPARALYARHRASAASISLYKQLCALTAALACLATIVPGAVKALARYTFKTVDKYGGQFSGCRDLVRATIEAGSLAELAEIVEALHKSSSILVVRAKDRFNQLAAELLPIGGYRDYQALCLFQVEPGVWAWGEIQCNLAEMVQIKKTPGGGHDAFKFARSISAYSEGTYLFKGSIDAEVCERVAAGVLLRLDLRGDRTIENNPNPWLLVKLCTALRSATCRLIDLNLGGNHLDPAHADPIIEALKVNTSLTFLELRGNYFDAQWGQYSDAIKAAWGDRGGNLLMEPTVKYPVVNGVITPVVCPGP